MLIPIRIPGATGVDWKEGDFTATPIEGGTCIEADGPCRFCVMPQAIDFVIPAGRHVKVTVRPGEVLVEIT